MRTESAAVIQAAAQLIHRLYEILQKLGAMTLAFVVTDANLRNVVEKTFK
jgi:hypothetical protein